MMRQRLLIVAGALGALALYILIQFARIMILDSNVSSLPSLQLPIVERGNIYDRNGRLLAGTVTLDTVSAWMPQVNNLEETASHLAQTLGLDLEVLTARMRASQGFLYIKRKITPAESRAVQTLLRSGVLEGIQIQEEFGRVYPMEGLGAHWLGFVGTDNVGLSGIEHTYNQVLMPAETRGPPRQRGSDVYLTIDSSLQFAVEEVAQTTLTTNRASQVTALVTHAPTGEMLAMAQFPGYNPARFMEADENTRKNHIVETVYEPGSVFKIFSLGVLLESRAITTRSTFVCTGTYQITTPNGEIIRIRCNGVHGVVDPMAILQVSCNSGIAQASDLLDPDTFSNGIRAFGFGTTTGSPFVGEGAGILAPVDRWSYRTKPTVAFGQEIGITGLQLMQAASAIANEGLLLKTSFVRRVIGSGGDLVKQSRREEVRRVLSQQTSRDILEMLRAGVDMGFGIRARIRGVEVGGKTGTAQVLDVATGRYSDTDFIASIMTFIPALNPEYIIYVSVNTPRGHSIYGGQVAAPAARKIADQLVTLYGIAREGDKILEHDGNVRVTKPSFPLFTDTLPDFRGYAKRTLLPLLLREDMRVYFSGEGHVVRQVPSPGTPLIPGMELRLDFE